MAEQRADKEKTAFCQTNEELAVQAQAGDKGAISQLWNQTRGIIFMILARYYNRNPERFARCGVTMDDLEQEGFFAVLEAVEAFNPAKGWKFTSWLNYPLQNHVNAILGTRSGQIKHIPLNECSSLDEPISQESDDMTLGDSVEDQTALEAFQGVEDRAYNSQLHDTLEVCLSFLEKPLERAVRGQYYENKSLKELGRELGVSYQYARDLKNKGLRKLRGGKARRLLLEYADEIISGGACQGTGFQSWSSYGSVEETTIEYLERIGILKAR